MTDSTRREALGLLAAAVLPAPDLGAHPWPAFKARYFTPDGRIVDTGNGGISHSEGQGYGMLLAQSAGDRDGFDRLWRWTMATLLRADAGLFSWRYDPAATPPVADRNNATDGDLLIAWALLVAAKRWRDRAYDDAARAILKAVAAQLVVQASIGAVLLPGLEGFRTDTAVTLNPSYWVWPALDAFRSADPGGPWAPVQAGGEALLGKAAFGPAKLPSDWVDLAAGGAVAPAAGRPPRFGYDAIRTPLYLAWARRTAGLAPYQAFWGPDVAAGKPPPAWVDVTSGEAASYPAAPGGVAVARWTCGAPAAAVPPGDYYSDVLAALVWLARTETSGRRA
jgi:endoglucanase